MTSGVCLAIGYAIGVTVERAARRAARWPRGRPQLGRPRPAAAVTVALVVGVAGALAWATWQDEARDLVGMSHLAWWEGPPMAVLSVVVGMALVWVGATVGGWPRVAHRGLRRRLPAWLALPATILLVVAFIGLVGSQVAMRGFVVAANVIYEALDQGTNRGIDQPTLATVSGSPLSLVGWGTMGLWGRDFVAGVTSRDQLLAYHPGLRPCPTPLLPDYGRAPSPSARQSSGLQRDDYDANLVTVLDVPVCLPNPFEREGRSMTGLIAPRSSRTEMCTRWVGALIAAESGRQ